MTESPQLTSAVLRSTGRLVVAPESVTVGRLTSNAHDIPEQGHVIVYAPKLDFGLVDHVVNSDVVGAVVITDDDYSDHARKMLHEAGIALIIHDSNDFKAEERGVVDHSGLTLLGDGVQVSAICSVLNTRNLSRYRSFGVDALGYFRFKFALFQLYAREPGSYADAGRVEAYLREQLAGMGTQGWSSIRCVLSDPTSAELAEAGIPVLSEVNPDLGIRGPRDLQRWRPELEAIKWFLSEYDTPIKICAPFISSVNEYLAFEALVAEVGIDRTRVELGFTLEVPALAEELDDLFEATTVDFMAIGTSDLFALFNGIDRNNNALDVEPSSVPNLRLLRRVVSKAHRHGVEAFVCGEVRRSEALMAELLSAGVTELISSARTEELITVLRMSRSGARASA